MEQHDCDLIIVGAGAAGIAAGLTARGAGLSTRILEAASRVGGRAHTVSLGGVPFDVGCHYLHHAGRNPLAALALARDLELRFDLYALDTPGWLVRRGHREDESVRDAVEAYYDAAFDALEHEEPDDVALRELVDATSEHYPLFQAWCAAHWGAPPERLSALDAWRLEDRDHDWPVARGFGALVHDLAAELDVTLDSPVSAIQRTRQGVTVQTSGGSLSARAVLVTVSTEVLRSGVIRFEPGLPDEVQQALEGVRLGHAERIGLRTDGRVTAPDDPLGAHVLLDDGSALQLYFHEFGEPIVTAYLAGDLARDLAREEPEATVAVAKQALVDVLGESARAHVIDQVSSSWTRDPLIRGGYSTALPGRAADRRVLATAFDERVRLAGEACSIEHFGTVHGAWATGVEGVSRLIAEGLRPDLARGTQA